MSAKSQGWGNGSPWKSPADWVSQAVVTLDAIDIRSDAIVGNSTAADVNVTLPTARAFGRRLLFIRNNGTANNLNVDDAAGDTINGGAGPFAVAGAVGGASAVLMSDGISNWVQVG